MRNNHQVYRSPQNSVWKCRRGPSNVFGGQNNVTSEKMSKSRLSHFDYIPNHPVRGWFVKYRLKTHRQVCRSPWNLVWKCGIILSNVINGQNPVMCTLCGAHQGKKDIGATYPRKGNYTRGARYQFLWKMCTFSLIFLDHSGFPRWNTHISSKLISWNNLNIKPHPQLVNLHEFLEIGSIEKKSVG